MYIASLRNFLQSSDSRKISLFSFPVVAIAVLLGCAIGKNVSGKSTSLNQQKAAVLSSFQNLAERAIVTDNSEQGPLFIDSAHSLEIEGKDFELLTSNKATASNYVRFPHAKLNNNSGRKVMQATVCLVRPETAERTCLRFYDLKLAPGGSLAVQPKDWALPNARMQVKRNETTGEFSHASKKIDLESATMWLPGRIADFTLELQSVKFEDNTKWVTKH